MLLAALIVLAPSLVHRNTAGAAAIAAPDSLIVDFCHNRGFFGITYTFCAIMDFTSDCGGWSALTQDLTNPSPYEFCAPFIAPSQVRGSWTDETQTESFDWSWSYATALCDSIGAYITMLQYDIDYTIMEPGDCPVETARSSCLTPRYYMYTLEDVHQPAGWQPYCYVISSNGPPSVEIQARVCSVPGFDYAFRATNLPYSGWVYADCMGNASYGWPDWQSEWYRPGYAR
jgi:hypothetical protein